MNQRCIVPECDTFAKSDPYGGFCMTCFAARFPNKPTKVNLWQKAMSDKVMEWKENGILADGGTELRLDCYDVSYGKNRPLRIDAWVQTTDGITIGFEADGPTHFSPVLLYGLERAEQNFLGIYHRDRLKEHHCRENHASTK